MSSSDRVCCGGLGIEHGRGIEKKMTTVRWEAQVEKVLPHQRRSSYPGWRPDAGIGDDDEHHGAGGTTMALAKMTFRLNWGSQEKEVTMGAS